MQPDLLHPKVADEPRADGLLERLEAAEAPQPTHDVCLTVSCGLKNRFIETGRTVGYEALDNLKMAALCRAS